MIRPNSACTPRPRDRHFRDVRPGDRIAMPGGYWYEVADVRAVGDYGVDVSVISREGVKDSWMRNPGAIVYIQDEE